MSRFLSLPLLLLLICSCSPSDTQRIWLDKRSDSLSVIMFEVNGICRDSFQIPHEVYRFELGDLTGDGKQEIAVGVVKKTKYWRTEDKRLFIYHIFDGEKIRPEWLGSRVGNPLKDFRVCNDSVPARILTEEYLEDSTIVRRMYRLRGFGLKFEKQL